MSRTAALDAALAHVDSGTLLADLSRRVAFRTESQRPGRVPELRAYLADEMVPAVTRLGCTARIIENPHRRPENSSLRTGSRPLPYPPCSLRPRRRDRGHDEQWSAGLVRGGSWHATAAGTAAGPPTTRDSTRSIWRRWQTSCAIRGRLGFNAKLLVEMGEEVGLTGPARAARALPRRARAPTCSSPRTVRAWPPTHRRSSSAPAAHPISCCEWPFATVRTTRATGAACCQSGDHTGRRPGEHRRWPRANPGTGTAAATGSGQRPASAAPSPCRWRPARSPRRRGLGRTGFDPSGTARGLEHLRDTRHRRGQSGRAGGRNSRHRCGALRAQIGSRHRRGRARRRAARTPRHPWVRHG